MVASEAPVVVCTYPARDQAEEFVAVLREDGTMTVAVPSDHHVGAWDVLVPARDADRVHQFVNALLAPH